MSALKSNKLSKSSKLVISIKLAASFAVFILVMGLFSCSKTSEERSDSIENDSKAEVETVSDQDFNESNEDLLTVDYKEFYDELAPHGEWIEVTDKDLGMDMNGTASGERHDGISPVRKHAKMSFWDLFGVKEARADDVGFGAFFVWKPSPNLAVGISAGQTTEPEPYYQPYTNGQWIHTDAGWYFRAATPVEEITHHHGRWVYSPAAGWVWVPGRVWAPAWVDWREENDYIAWAPVPPSVYLVNNVVVVPPPVVVEERYVVVERRYFVEPYVYKHVYWHHHHPGKFKVKHWRRLDGVMVVNNTIIDRGPDVTIIQNVTGRQITTVRVNRVNDFGQVRYVDNEIYTYSPGFKKVKDKGNRNRSFNKPEKFNTFSGASNDEKNRRDELSRQKNDKINLANDNDMYKGKNSNDKGRGSDKNADNNWKKENGNKQNDGVKNDNKRNKDRGNDNGNKNKGNDNKSKGNDNKNDGVKQKGNDNGNKNKGNDNKGNDNKGRDKKKFNRSNDGNKDIKGNDNKSKGNDKGINSRGNERIKKDNGNKNDGNKKGSNDNGRKNENGNKDKGNKKGKR